MPEAQPLRTSIAELLVVIRAEYLEVPGLRLTTAQVERLWGLDALESEAMLAALVDVRFLRRNHTGAYIRADDGY